MLETAKLVTDVYEGTGSASSTTTSVADVYMKYPVGTYNGGTMWSAKADDTVVEIKTQGQNLITVVAAQTSALTGAYQMADATFPMYKLKQAVLQTLGNIDFQP